MQDNKEIYDGMLVKKADNNLSGKDCELFYYMQVLKISSAGQVVSKKFNTPVGYEALVGVIINSSKVEWSFGYKKLEGTLGISVNGNEVIPKGTASNFFYNNSYATFEDRVFNKINEKIERSNVELV